MSKAILRASYCDPKRLANSFWGSVGVVMDEMVKNGYKREEITCELIKQYIKDKKLLDEK
jgi:hypothetical protein